MWTGGEGEEEEEEEEREEEHQEQVCRTALLQDAKGRSACLWTQVFLPPLLSTGQRSGDMLRAGKGQGKEERAVETRRVRQMTSISRRVSCCGKDGCFWMPKIT